MRPVSVARRFIAFYQSDERRGPTCRDTSCSAASPEGLRIPIADSGAELCHGVIERNAEEGVTWLRSYVSEDKRTTFGVYDAPTPEAIRKTAGRNALPVDEITQVRVLDPYFYV